MLRCQDEALAFARILPFACIGRGLAGAVAFAGIDAGAVDLVGGRRWRGNKCASQHQGCRSGGNACSRDKCRFHFFLVGYRCSLASDGSAFPDVL